MKFKIFTRKNFFAILTIVFLLLSLYAGYVGGAVNTALWIVFALLAFASIYKAFPNFWKYSFLLLVIYVFAGIGGSLLTTRLLIFMAIGLVCEVIAVLTMHTVASKVIKLREQYGYCPLGLWFVALMLFFIFSNISLSDWARWVVGKSNLSLYILAEAALILLLIYILWLPGARLKYVNTCRFCNASIRFEALACPSCGYERKVAYCAKGEHWLVECKFCKALTIYGRDKCMACIKSLPKKLECEFCGTTSSLRDWKKLD
ncbi:MAG: hypothetical protein QMD21_04350 [Candidatus Thermoplasmatota archaeon]|nr:hypothetical protein [Candidatus Thermoplasmatota archaeon]